LIIELKKAGLDTESEKPISVYYDNKIVGAFIADIIVNDTIILELKSVRRIIKAHACGSEVDIPQSGSKRGADPAIGAP
jgi:GxxExxY protein